MINTGRKAPRWIWLTLTWTGLGLGTAGAILPVLPTTPFLLFALWTGSRANPRLRFRLYRHPRFGASLRAWHRHGAVPRRAKWLACALMAASAASLWLADAAPALLAGVLVLFTAVAAFLLTRPSPLEPTRIARECRPTP
ncbi:MAG: DUF454 family protein [Gammaproteobacteria bacterium]|jgi:uncharacterized membrane protein YbaN (DUF454 family)|nr:DUF454 family protein [Gammaproteobacteria bacterium]